MQTMLMIWDGTNGHNTCFTLYRYEELFICLNLCVQISCPKNDLSTLKAYFSFLVAIVYNCKLNCRFFWSGIRVQNINPFNQSNFIFPLNKFTVCSVRSNTSKKSLFSEWPKASQENKQFQNSTLCWCLPNKKQPFWPKIRLLVMFTFEKAPSSMPL